MHESCDFNLFFIVNCVLHCARWLRRPPPTYIGIATVATDHPTSLQCVHSHGKD